MTGFASCNYVNANFQKKLKGCDGNPLPDGAEVATCDDLAALAPNLKGCDGNPLPAGANVPTCAEVETAIDAVETAIATKQGQLRDCAGTNLAANAQVPLCSEIPALVTANETATTMVETSGAKTWSYVNEDATTKVLNNSQIISANAGNAIAVGTDGGLMLSIPAQLPDDQLLSGDNSGNVQITLTPDTTTTPGQTNYTVKADLKVAATNPDGSANALQTTGGAFFVAKATDTTAGVSALNLGTSLPGDATNTTDALTAAGFNTMANSATANPLKTAIAAAVPDTAKTVRGLVNLTDLQQMGDGRKVFDAGVHVGSGNPAFAGRATVTAIGPNAGQNNTGDNQTATGRAAGQNNTGDNQTATGSFAGQNNTGDHQTATGVAAGQNNTGVYQTATGFFAGQNNTGDHQTATGVAAGQNNTGVYQTATGRDAGQNNTGDYQTATGHAAGYNNTGLNNSFYGYESGTQTGALLGTVTMTPSSSTAGTVSPALPASVVGKSLPVNISGYDWRVLTFTSTTAYTMVGGPASGTWTASVYEGLAFNNVTALGYDSEPTASNQVMLGNGAVTEVRTAGTYFGAGFTTVSDATLKEKVEPIDPAKALQFRNGLQWKHYEVFAETQSEVKVEKTFDREETVVNEDGSVETKTITVTVSEPTGAYKVTRTSQGTKYGLIAQDVQALAETVGAFGDVVVKIGEYFTLDERGFPVKDADGNVIVNDRLGLDYDAINVIVMAGEQAALAK